MEKAGQLATAEMVEAFDDLPQKSTKLEDAFCDQQREFQDNQMVFIEEEFYELLHAYNNLNHEDIIKEACDLIWVTYGLLHTMSVNTDEAFKRVSDSNNTKLPFTYKDGKVQKGPNYKPPVLTDL
tara:strand:+ start:239 stop:613 length:375 start_codon:yes stop_codon:yes gene_type:complete